MPLGATAQLTPAKLAPSGPASSAAPPLSGSLRPGLPILLYGVRVWAAVCLALFVAFQLELQNPFWAGTTAAIVCQPELGASLRKGWFRLIGTVIGATASVVLTACFPQSRIGFLLSLALWGAACALVATILRNFASYAAALSGYTAAIVAGDELGAVGGANGEAFNLAITRATEICIGIVCAGVILATTDFGGARRRLALLLATLSKDIAGGLLDALGHGSAAQAESRALRRDLVRRVAGLSVLMDQAAGEISGLPFRPRAMRAAADRLLGALSAWRVIATHLERAPEMHKEVGTVLRALPEEVWALTDRADSLHWQDDPIGIRHTFLAAARRLLAVRTATPSVQLLLDRTVEGLLGVRAGLAGVALLSLRRRVSIRISFAWVPIPDMLPALVNALRAFLTIIAAELIWIETAWPSGATFITFASVTVILFAPRADAAFGMAMNFVIGNGITAILAGIVAFAILPQQPTLIGFCVAIGLVLVPAGALSAQSWRQPMFVAMAANFIPLLGPSNPMSYNPAQFYNTASSLLPGVGLAMLAMRLLPPVPPEMRARRLLTLTLRDLRRLAAARISLRAADWESRGYGRLSAMPDQAAPLQRARLAAALSVGTEIIRLRRIAARFELDADVQPVLHAIAAGNSGSAMERLGQFDRILAGFPPEVPGLKLRLRARAAICAIAETLSTHSSYFDADMRA